MKPTHSGRCRKNISIMESRGRLSTNEKLAMVMNAKDDDGEAVDDDYNGDDAKVKQKLRRHVLYHQGGRAIIPKVKRPEATSKSPFALTQAALENKGDRLDFSQIPGVHEDHYRIVQYNTTKCKNDPDRVFFTTTSCTDGVKFSRQPRWYYGNQNKTKPADGSMLMTATRYGYRGAKDINQRHTQFHEPPSRTRTEHTPKFLSGNDVIDEWVPPLLATTFGTVNNMESPKLWPENSAFVTGYPLKKTSSMTIYNRETTVGMDERPQTSVNLDDWFGRTSTLNGTLKDFANLESTKTLFSAPMQEKITCEAAWKDRIAKTANPSLRRTLREEKIPYDPHRLLDTSDSIRYASSSSLIVHTQSAEELKFRFQLQRAQSLVAYELKWRQVITCFKAVKGRVKRDQTMNFVLREIAAALRREGVSIGTPTSLNRLDFIHVLSKNKYFELMSKKAISLTFSVFDPLKRNSIRFVELIASLAVLDTPLDTAMQKLAYLWSIISTYGDDQGGFSVALAALTSCCRSDQDQRDIEKSFAKTFRPAAYQAAVGTRNMEDSQAVLDITRMVATTSKPVTPVQNAKGSPTKPYQNSSTVGKTRNICDDYFCQETFIDVLRQCPELTQIFDAQLSEVLKEMYGKDARYEVEAAPVEGTTQDKDFSWILSKSSGKSSK